MLDVEEYVYYAPRAENGGSDFVFLYNNAKRFTH